MNSQLYLLVENLLVIRSMELIYWNIFMYMYRCTYKGCCVGPGGASGRSGGACICSIRRSVGGGQHLRWPFESSCHIWIGHWRQHHRLDCYLLLDFPIVGIIGCLPPTQVCHKCPGMSLYYSYLFFNNLIF